MVKDVRRKRGEARRWNEGKPSASHHTDDSEGRREGNLETCKPLQEDFRSHEWILQDGACVVSVREPSAFNCLCSQARRGVEMIRATRL